MSKDPDYDGLEPADIPMINLDNDFGRFPRCRSSAGRHLTGGSGTLSISPALTGGGTVHVIIDATGYFD